MGDGVGVDVRVGVGVLVGVRAVVGDGVGVLVRVDEGVGVGLTVGVGLLARVTVCRLCGVGVGGAVVVVSIGELQDKLDSIARTARPIMTMTLAGMEIDAIPQCSGVVLRSSP